MYGNLPLCSLMGSNARKEQGVYFMKGNKKWKFFASGILLAVAILSGTFFGIVTSTEAAAQGTANTSFKKYYNKTLVPRYGMFEKTQAGTMRTWDDEWLKTSGILGVSIMDFDMDGKKEMLLCVAEPLRDKKNSCIRLKMYEKAKGKVKKSSEIRFGPYYNGKQTGAAGEIVLSPSEWNEASYIISSVTVGKKRYIVCEEKQLWGVFADGSTKDYWILEYKNKDLRYVRSLTQSAGGSSDFEYTAFSFKKGKLSKKELYYADKETGHKAKYKSYSQAITALFKQCDITLNQNVSDHKVTNKSILSTKGKPRKLFNFYNQVIQNNYSTRTYKFKATVHSANRSL